MQKICVVASGGDAPGMNACIESIYRNATKAGVEVWASIFGFKGLIENEFVKLSMQNAVCISERSGCVFKCGRAVSFLTHDGFATALKNIKDNGFDAIVCMGGNGSTNGCGRLKNAGVNVVVIPATIDNDVDFSEHALGFDSACEIGTKAVDMLRATMETSERNFIVEIMGRHCNKLTERIGISTFADVVDMQGNRHTAKQIADIFAENRRVGKVSNFLLMQERKGDDYVSQTIDTMKFVDEIIKETGDKDIRLTSVGYLQRGTDPNYFDRYLAAVYGKQAVDCVIKKQFGVGITMHDYKIVLKDIKIDKIP